MNAKLCLLFIREDILVVLLNLGDSTFKYGTIVRTGITCTKIPCYMRDSSSRWFIVKKAIIF